MGDMADMLVDQMLDEWPRHTVQRATPLRCKFCGTTKVKWGKLSGQWRLFTNGEPHTCAAFHTQRGEPNMGFAQGNTDQKPQDLRGLSVVRHDGKLLLDGKFFMVQRADLGANTSTSCKTDVYGNPTLEWPGRSVYSTRDEAEEVAALLAAKSPGYPFVVMEAVVAVAQAAPVLAKRTMPLTRR